MKIILLTVQTPFIFGGAEVLLEDLREALSQRGHTVAVVGIPCDFHPDHLTDEMAACRLLNLSYSRADLVIGLKFPAYLCPHPQKVLWILHQFRDAYNLWNYDLSLLSTLRDGTNLRQAVIAADEMALNEARALFTISRTVSNRLQTYCRHQAPHLYPPVRTPERYWCGEDDAFLFFPSRLNPSKRQSLALRALVHAPGVRLYFSGTSRDASDQSELRRLAVKLGVDNRVRFLGQVSEDEKLNLYAHSRGVVFCPYDEDYGYVTLEAMLASKPVLTCTDSGGTLEFVVGGQTGWVCQPDPERMGEAMAELWHSPRAAEFGREGRQRYFQVIPEWDKVVATLLGEAI